MRAQQQRGGPADRAVDPRRPDVVVVHVDDERRCRDDPSGRLRVGLTQPDDVAAPLALVTNLLRERSWPNVVAACCRVKGDRDARLQEAEPDLDVLLAPPHELRAEAADVDQRLPGDADVARPEVERIGDRARTCKPLDTITKESERRAVDVEFPLRTHEHRRFGRCGVEFAMRYPRLAAHGHVVVDEPAHVASRHRNARVSSRRSARVRLPVPAQFDTEMQLVESFRRPVGRSIEHDHHLGIGPVRKRLVDGREQSEQRVTSLVRGNDDRHRHRVAHPSRRGVQYATPDRTSAPLVRGGRRFVT